MNAAAPPIARRDLLLSGILAGASVLAFARQPRAPAETAPMTIGRAVPSRIGAFRQAMAQGFVLPASGPLTERSYVDLVTRLYRAPDAPPVMLLAAQGRAGDPGMSVHRPERCYRAAGFDIEDASVVPLPAPFPRGAQAVRMTARREDRVEQLFFWTRIGARFPASALEQRLDTVKANLAGVLPPGLLFRLSVLGSDAAPAFALLQGFNAELFEGLNAPARMTLLGR